MPEDCVMGIANIKEIGPNFGEIAIFTKGLASPAKRNDAGSMPAVDNQAGFPMKLPEFHY